MPLFILFFLFLAVYAEIAVLINVGGEIGVFGVIAMSILTAAVGLMLVRIQGFDVYRRMVEATNRGEAPVDDMMHGFLLLISGFLLIIPGFISDGIGALLLIPFVRSQIITHGILKHATGFYARTRPGFTDTTIIEGEYRKKDQKEADRPALKDDNKE